MPSVLFFSFVLFSNPPRSFFRLNHVRKVRKRCSHSRFSFQQQFWEFLTEALACVVRVFPLLMGAVTTWVKQWREVKKKFYSISLVFFHFHFHFGVIRDSCWPWRWKYPYKVILSTIQPNVNFYMLRAQVLAKKYPTATTRIAQWVFYSLFTQSLFGNTDRKLLRIMSGFNIKGE